MSLTPREPACSSVQEEIEALAAPDSANVPFDRRFFPRDRLLALFSRTKVQDILQCHCVRCERHRLLLKRRADPTRYLDRIVGKPGEGQHPAFTAIELFALLVYIGYPSFIISFIQQECNDHVLATHRSGFTEDHLKGAYWSKFDEQQPKTSSALATKFRSRMYQFAVPQMNDDHYTLYDKWTIFPFFNEKPLGKTTEDGEFIHEGAHGQVVSFEIWDGYGNLPHATGIKKYARKELNDSSSQRFHNELNNLERVRKLQDDHIIKVLKSYRHGDKFVLVFPCARTNLGTYLRDTRFGEAGVQTEELESSAIWQQMLGVTNALRRILNYKDPSLEPEDRLYGYHFDIKPENILVEDSGTLVISDFGQSTFKRVNGTSSKVVGMGGTESYAPPEIDDLDLRQNQKYDVFSLGCILLEIVTFVVKGHSGVKELDSIRITKINGTNRQDDRFFTRNQAKPGYEIKSQIRRWMDELPLSDQVRSIGSKAFINDVMLLTKQMLDVNVETRLRVEDAFTILKSILDKYQSSNALHRLIRYRELECGTWEVELGRYRVEVLQNLSCQDTTIGSWCRAQVRVFGENRDNLRIVTVINTPTGNSIHSITGQRHGVKLIPTYALHDPTYYQFLDGHIYFSRMSHSDPLPFRGAKYSFHPVMEAVMLQGVLTEQDIVRSYSISGASFVVPPKLTRRIKDVYKRPKPLQHAVMGQQAWTAQLWAETCGEPSSIAMMGSCLLGPPPRRIVVYFDKIIVIVRLAKNVRVQQRTPESNAKVLRLVPTDAVKDASFMISILGCTNDDPLPGIPLCRASLHEFEEKGKVECKSFDLEFKSAEDLNSCYRHYQLLKKAWTFDAKAIERWQNNMGARTGFTLD